MFSYFDIRFPFLTRMCSFTYSCFTVSHWLIHDCLNHLNIDVFHLLKVFSIVFSFFDALIYVFIHSPLIHVLIHLKHILFLSLQASPLLAPQAAMGNTPMIPSQSFLDLSVPDLYTQMHWKIHSAPTSATQILSSHRDKICTRF